MNNTDEIKPSEIKPTELDNLKKKLEAKGMQQVNDAKTNTTITFGDNLSNIMQSGFNEFKKETGRQMTYSEMREMYG